MTTREEGVIQNAYRDDAFHGSKTVWVQVEYLMGSTQGYGGLALDGWQEVYERDLCDTFGVQALADLKGLRCFALRAGSHFDAIIVGLECPATGRVFSHKTWREAHGMSRTQPDDTTWWDRLMKSV